MTTNTSAMASRALLAAVALIIFSCATPSHAQTTVDSTSTSNVSTGAQAGANNQGNTFQTATTFNSPGQQDRTTARVEAVAPLGLGGAAAGFSNENCANTVQGGISTMWFAAAKGSAKESIRCNARRDAGVYVALAADARDNGYRIQAAALRTMAWWKMCTATEADVEACKRLGLLGDEDMKNAPEQDNSGTAIPHRESGWTNEAMVDKREVPRHP